jgi:hypothetical protein
MRGRYGSIVAYARAKAARGLLRAVLRPLVRWSPMTDPRPGYTVIIGCSTPLMAMLGVNLRMLAAQRAENLREVLVVFDRRRSPAHAALEERVRAEHPNLPARFLYYRGVQERVARAIQWGWVYSWMSWCTGIAHATTRHVVLHDFDAILLHPGVLEARFAEIVRRGHEFVGVSLYKGNGVEASDGLVTTFELILDAAFVRERFRPIHAFNHVTTHHGRTVDFDTFLYVQSRAGARSVLPVDEEAMVHPSQMICQYVDHLNGRLPAIEANNLLLIPYFMYLSGEPGPFREVRRRLDGAGERRVNIFGKPADLSRLSPVHAAWLSKQAFRLERAIAGEVREEVRSYFGAIEAMASGGTPPPRGSAPEAAAAVAGATPA